jgi:putative FmdB family regulatory protein
VEDKMPIYEYFCPQCKAEFELRLSFSEFDRPQKCPKGHSGPQRLISSFSTKNAGNVEIAEKPFRKSAGKATKSQTPDVPVTAPIQKKLRSTPAKKSIPARPKKK